MILDDIVKASRADLAEQMASFPLSEMKKLALARPRPLDLATVLQGPGIKLIAEVKQASPSRGVIVRDFEPAQIARIYAASGAAAISVLTERHYFHGSLDDLLKINLALGPSRPPLLRKDFIYDPYQLYAARAFGADAVLLIVAILDPELLDSLLELAAELNLNCVVEVHTVAEMAIAIRSRAKIIGINNRDLKTLAVDIDATGRLRRLIPSDRIVVSESGIRTRQDVQKLRDWGVDAMLVGESLLTSGDPRARIQELL